MEDILEGEKTGVAMKDFDAASLGAAAERILALAADGETRNRCRQTALSRFSLDGGVAAYRTIYRELVATS